MAALVSEFFGLSGLDMVPPQTFAELLPYLLQVTVAVVLVLAVFRVIGSIVRLFCDGRWLR